MSDMGHINAKFIFIEGLSEDTTWDDLLVKIAEFRDKVHDAAAVTANMEEEQVPEWDRRLDNGKLQLDDEQYMEGNVRKTRKGPLLKCCVFMMGERQENFMGGHLLGSLWKSLVPDYKGDESLVNDDDVISDVFREICRRWRCCCDVYWASESSFYAYRRYILSPFGKLWNGWQTGLGHQPADLLENPTWANVIGPEWEWMKRRIEDEKKKKKSKTDSVEAHIEGPHTCCICGKEFKGFGHNPLPLKDEGVCCDECNEKVVEKRKEML